MLVLPHNIDVNNVGIRIIHDTGIQQIAVNAGVLVYDYNCRLISSGLVPFSNLRSTLFGPIIMCVLLKLVLIRYFYIPLRKAIVCRKSLSRRFSSFIRGFIFDCVDFFEGVYHGYALIIFI